MERRLAAILSYDVVGYSRLMEADEAGTLAALKAARHDLIDPLIRERNGRIVKLMGDAALVEFASVVDAVECAVAVQEGMQTRNDEDVDGRRLDLRIGVHLGDVIVDVDDIYGDGVNIASRLEGLAEPGGICMSRQAYDHVETQLNLATEDLGEQQVKNISRKIRAYRLAVGRARWGASTMAAAGIPALPDKPVIAVLPFANLSGGAEQDYFADGISEDIITGLSRNADLFVISRNTSFAFKGRSLRIPDVGKELGAQYVLEGSVRRAGQRVRVTAQLIDAARDLHLWAERYDRELDDIFEVQDEIVGSIVHALGAAEGAIEKAVRQSRMRVPGPSQSAYDSYLQAREHFYRPGGSGYGEAETLYRKAIALDPGFARAYSALAWLHFLRFKSLETASLASVEERTLDLAQQTLRLDPDDYRAHWVLGALYMQQGRHAQSLAEFDRALRINPNDANLLIFSTNELVYCGRVQEALERCERAIRLNPNAPDWYWWQLGFARFHLGRYEEALEALRRMAAPRQARRLLSATYAQLGRLEEARREAEEFLKNTPDFSIGAWARTEPYVDPGELERFLAGLRKAGLPE